MTAPTDDEATEPTHTEPTHTEPTHTEPPHTGPTGIDPETLEPLSHDTQSGEADYVATSPGGSGTERHVPTADEEQGRGTEYDPVDQGPQQEGQGG